MSPEAHAAEGAGVPLHRGMITGTVMVASILQALDNTIANVALPRMQGSLSATQDQMTWVLTSYIIAAAIMTPLTGWLADRFGRKPLFRSLSSASHWRRRCAAWRSRWIKLSSFVCCRVCSVPP